MTNVVYLEKINNLVDMESTLKVQLHDKYIVDIVTEMKYIEGEYEIINPYKK